MKKLVDTFPKSMSERVFVVRTGVDVGLQRKTEDAVETSLRQYGKEYGASQAAMVVMDIDGSVRAMVGGRDYGASQFNRATDALRQPGSSFKPYVYATALSNGFKPTSIVVDSPVCIGNWCPQNYSRSYAGSITLTQALVRSINVIPVKLSIALGDGNPKLGRAKIIDTARKMGIRSPLTDSTSLPIGAAEVTVLDHVGAYATFPNAGKAVTPHAILEVRTGAGETIWRFDRDGKKPVQVLRPQVAMDMALMMSKVVEEGTGRHQGRRQDRHHQRLPRRLVHGLHRQLRRRHLDGQRRLFPDQAHDRRLAAGHDLARRDGVCPPGDRAENHPGGRSQPAAERAGRGRGGEERRGGAAAGRADTERRAGAVAGRARDGGCRARPRGRAGHRRCGAAAANCRCDRVGVGPASARRDSR
jgi:hypothetical protein